MRVAKTWNGLDFVARLDRAAGRSIVAIGMNVAVETKRVTHVEEGNLRRSVHAAPRSASHDGDEDAAKTGDLMSMSDVPKPEHTEIGPAIEVGSWLPYACVEWIGRGHPGVTQGLEVVRGSRADAIVAQAFAEEGLAGHR